MAPPPPTLGPPEEAPAGAAAPYRAPAWEAAGPSRGRRAFRPLALIGGILIIAAGPLPWLQFHFEGAGWNLLFKFLFTGNRVDFVKNFGNPGFDIASIGVALIVLGIIVVVLSFVPAAHVVRRLLGLLAVAIVAGFVVQLLVGQANETVGHLFKDLGPGEYCAFVGGILALVG